MVSLQAFGQYHADLGRVWERQTLLKARPCAGEARTGELALEMISDLLARALHPGRSSAPRHAPPDGKGEGIAGRGSRDSPQAWARRYGGHRVLGQYLPAHEVGRRPSGQDHQDREGHPMDEGLWGDLGKGRGMTLVGPPFLQRVGEPSGAGPGVQGYGSTLYRPGPHGLGAFGRSVGPPPACRVKGSRTS